MFSFDFFPFLFTGAAFIGGVAFCFTVIVAVVAIPKSHAAYRYIVLAAPFVAAAWWWNLAVVEVEKAKPEHDYAYLIPSSYIAPNGLIVLSTISTGTLRNARIAVRRVGPDDKPEPNYIYSNGIDGVTIDEGGNLSQVALPPGSFDIDIDPPTKFGKVSERLKIQKMDSSLGYTVLATRKGSREVLVPPPEEIPFTHKLLLLFFVGQFLTFSLALAWGSWVTS